MKLQRHGYCISHVMSMQHDYLHGVILRRSVQRPHHHQEKRMHP